MVLGWLDGSGGGTGWGCGGKVLVLHPIATLPWPTFLRHRRLRTHQRAVLLMLHWTLVHFRREMLLLRYIRI